ncbi:TetR/AcrR family transcriptional regulator [Arcanobacterium buesumense]|uniref:TetR/AcrR family transcriptional regulator n=1 Tax=Arcanobacterium buesumense TaxID=2722751 RepID=A0A6H2EM41_9ACTO|nr:TetR/AcrR family transcriptional regulator [Arcanobacterium buesumense]QJC22148.1 TetR/AcrR family transcriptional regulator [Arcanobacterium buesumense]
MSDRFETQERLIAATRQVMVTHGIEGCTLERICAQAGYSRGAFYSNFIDKEELFTFVARYEYDTTISRMNEVLVQWEEELEAGVLPLSEQADHIHKMNVLLGKALAALHLDRYYFIVHNEMLVRAIRVPAWGKQFSDINREFVSSMAKILNKILAIVGRQMTSESEIVAQAVIGVALRSSGYAAWQQEDLAGSGDEINALIVQLLEACSEPISSEN